MSEDFEYIEGCKNDVCINITVFIYNHSSYLRQALDSIFMQKTQYSYNLIVGEDYSTDGSRKILMEYYKKYPDKMNLILWKHNVGVEKNSVEIYKKCKGKYIAYLEGDDYWTDPLKLEKQVSFLESNSQYIGVSHNIKCINKNGKLLHRDFSVYSYQQDHIYGWDNAGRFELAGQTASMFHKNIYKYFGEKEWKAYLECDANGDMKTCIILASMGEIYFMKDIMADHRRVFDEGESWTAKMTGKNMLWLDYYMRYELKKYMNSEFQVDVGGNLYEMAKTYYDQSVIQMLYHPTKENLNVLLMLYREKRKYEKR